MQHYDELLNVLFMCLRQRQHPGKTHMLLSGVHRWTAYCLKIEEKKTEKSLLILVFNSSNGGTESGWETHTSCQPNGVKSCLWVESFLSSRGLNDQWLTII